jgi:hypothetical protein
MGFYMFIGLWRFAPSRGHCYLNKLEKNPAADNRHDNVANGHEERFPHRRNLLCRKRPKEWIALKVSFIKPKESPVPQGSGLVCYLSGRVM